MSDWSTALFEHSPIPMAVHRLIRDGRGEVQSFKFIATNRAFDQTWASQQHDWQTEGGPNCHPYPALEFDAIWQSYHWGAFMGTVDLRAWVESNKKWSQLRFYGINNDEFVCQIHDLPVEEQVGFENLRLEQVLHGISDAIQVFDLSGQLVFINQAAAFQSGIDSFDNTEHKATDFVSLFGPSGSWESHVKELRAGKLRVQRRLFHHGLGREMELEVNFSICVILGKEYVVAVSSDTSNRLDTHEELGKHMRMLELLIYMANTYINASIDQLELLINASLRDLGEFVAADRAYIFDYHFEKGHCTNTFEWCAKGIKSEIDQLQQVPIDILPYWIEKHQAGEAFFVDEVAALSEEQLELKNILLQQGIISLLTVPMRTPEGELLGFLGFDSVREKRIYSNREKQLLEVFSSMIVNMRQRAETQHRMNKAAAEAQAASKAKSEFLANMSHELRTPLNGVIGFVDLLRSTSLSPNQLEFVENTSTSARALLDLINDVLDFSKIEAGKLEIENAPCSLTTLVEQSIDIVKYESARKQLELLLDMDIQLPNQVKTDALRLKQILVNLLSNAIKFTQVGEVRLRVTGEAQQDFYLLRFEVHDTGIGISKEQQKHMFKAFSQGETSTSRRFGGTGLGLAISSFLVQKLGGDLTVESQPDHGSVFSFEIQVEVVASESLPYKSNALLKDKKVWLLEDHFGAEKLLRRTLEHWQATVLSFSSENHALSKMGDQCPSLLLIDGLLGNADGRSALKKIRAKGGTDWQNIPAILFQDATDNLSLTPEDEALHIHSKLSKPFKMNELYDAISAIQQPQDISKQTEKSKSEQPVRQVLSTDTRPLILLVDDVPLNLTLARWMLEKMVPGARILEARSGEAALLIHEQGLKIDLIFMDVQMPEMDGLETTRLIRQRETATKQGRHIPIVALTAGAMPEERSKCLAAGMDDFLSKPIHVEHLEMMILKFLQKK